ncbi:MAG: 4-hydroxy-3-methylbut-2-enyl diphosphate reductase [Gammaproteobacteria bacterium]|nr:4-hydroxy-3-methylbut-2-enyl diphosphate reductase [Gammaproteobacteria bacterium]
MDVKLANPRGFCAGVDRAIAIVDRALEIYGAPIYVRHEVVHNRFVVDCLRDKGAMFVDELAEVPDGAVVIFSAHGVPLRVREEAEGRGLKVFDATCPLVTKVHLEVARHQREVRECVLIGHAGHPEVEGTLGQYRGQYRDQHGDTGGGIYLVEKVADVEGLEVHDPENLAFTTQTTLSMDDTAAVIAALKERFPAIVGPRKDDICYATQNRQNAVKELTEDCDLLLVVGSVTSSNSNRLREIAEKRGVEAYLIDSADDLDAAWLTGKRHVGVTAGASAPEVLVQEVLERLRGLGATVTLDDGANREDVVFSLPRELAAAGR